MKNNIIAGLALAVLMAAASTGIAAAKDDTPAPAGKQTVDEVNVGVAKIEKELGILSFLNVEYNYNDATEGVPPSFKFYFAGKEKLVACRVHIGYEVWSRDITYYFDAEEKPMKYLVKDSGRPDESKPTAVIYGKKGEVLWENMDLPQLSPQEILTLFKMNQKRLKAFQRF